MKLAQIHRFGNHEARFFYEPTSAPPRETDNKLGYIVLKPNNYCQADDLSETDLDAMLPEMIGLRTVYLYTHSGAAVSLTPFSDHWDSAPAGHTFTTLDRMRRHGLDPRNPVDLKRARQILADEIAAYNEFLTGDRYSCQVHGICESCGQAKPETLATYGNVTNIQEMMKTLAQEFTS